MINDISVWLPEVRNFAVMAKYYTWLMYTPVSDMYVNALKNPNPSLVVSSHQTPPHVIARCQYSSVGQWTICNSNIMINQSILHRNHWSPIEVW